MFRFIKRAVKRKIQRRRDAKLEDTLVHSAFRFEQWIEEAGLQGDLRRIDEALGSALQKEELPESLANDAAAWFGEWVHAHHPEAHWREDDLYGLHLANLAGVEWGKFLPLALVEKKWELGARFSTAEFLDRFDERVEVEAERASAADVETEQVRWLEERRGDAIVVVHQHLQQWVAYWRRHFRSDLPLTLLGVREMDSFLRSHYLINFLREEELINAGFFVGEVTRGLFEGEWHLAEARSPADARLRFPELDYFPVGKVFKLMTERPEDQKLDEYILLVPSARSELRKQQAPKS